MKVSDFLVLQVQEMAILYDMECFKVEEHKQQCIRETETDNK